MPETQQFEKLIDGTVHTIDLNTGELLNHFNDRKNCTVEILHQFNDLDYYTQFITPDDKIILDLGGNVNSSIRFSNLRISLFLLNLNIFFNSII